MFVCSASAGLVTSFGLQAFVNMASALHLIPTKGMTLPFVFVRRLVRDRGGADDGNAARTDAAPQQGGVAVSVASTPSAARDGARVGRDRGRRHGRPFLSRRGARGRTRRPRPRHCADVRRALGRAAERGVRRAGAVRAVRRRHRRARRGRAAQGRDGALGCRHAAGARASWRIDAAAIVGFGGYPSVAPVTRRAAAPPPPARDAARAERGARPCQPDARRASPTCSRCRTTARRAVPAGVAHVVTGNPVRVRDRRAAAHASTRRPATRFDLLVLGGSLGARVLSDVVPAALANLPAHVRARLRIVQQCRAEDLDRVRAAYADCGIGAGTCAVLRRCRASGSPRAHLVIARAGASTVAELAVAGRPSILVPLPGAIDDHQTANARALADAGGAWLMPQPAFIRRIAGCAAQRTARRHRATGRTRPRRLRRSGTPMRPHASPISSSRRSSEGRSLHEGPCRSPSARSISSASAASACPASPKCCTRSATRCRAATSRTARTCAGCARPASRSRSAMTPPISATPRSSSSRRRCSADNPEVQAARARLIPVVRRAEMLAELMRLRWSIAIGGTHGKTTTTSLIAAVLEAAHLDPTVINGGIINAYGTEHAPRRGRVDGGRGRRERRQLPAPARDDRRRDEHGCRSTSTTGAPPRR